MAVILSLSEYQTRLGLAASTARDQALEAIINDVNDALVRFLRQPLERVARTEYLDAPLTDRIVLRYWPVVEVTTVKVATGSGGDPAKFTADTVWGQYTDWILELDESDDTCRRGTLRALRGWWAVNRRAPVGRLSVRLDPDYRAVQVVYTAGYQTIPPSLKTAAQLMVARIFASRTTGQMPGSASLNGGSYSLQSGGGDAGVLLGDPTIQSYLKPFMDIYV